MAESGSGAGAGAQLSASTVQASLALHLTDGGSGNIGREMVESEDAICAAADAAAVDAAAVELGGGASVPGENRSLGGVTGTLQLPASGTNEGGARAPTAGLPPLAVASRSAGGSLAALRLPFMSGSTGGGGSLDGGTPGGRRVISSSRNFGSGSNGGAGMGGGSSGGAGSGGGSGGGGGTPRTRAARALERLRHRHEEEPPSPREAALFAAWQPTATLASLIARFSALEPDERLGQDVQQVLAAKEAKNCTSSSGGEESIVCSLLRLLDTAVRAVSGDEAKALAFAAFNRLCAQAPTLRRILRLLLRDWGAVAGALSKNSYPHDNGFDKLVLGDYAGWRMRVHVWWPDERAWLEAVPLQQGPLSSPPLTTALMLTMRTPPHRLHTTARTLAGHDYQENAHDHRWPFASTMVLGKYRTQLLRPVDAANPAVLAAMQAHPERFDFFDHYMYESANALLPSNAASAGAAAVPQAAPAAAAAAAYGLHKVTEHNCLEICEDLEMLPGQSVVFPIHLIHRIIDESTQMGQQGLAGGITLMITAPSAKTSCNLYSQSEDIEDEGGTSVDRFSGEELQRRLLRTIACLDRGEILTLSVAGGAGSA